MKTLLLNHQHVECGVHQFAKRVYNLCLKSTKTKCFYSVVSNREEYIRAIKLIKPDFIIYNYHKDRMEWLQKEDIIGNTAAKHYFIYHDDGIFSYYDKYLFFGSISCNEKICEPEKRIILPRPLIDYTGPYPINNVPNIGSFGFAFNHKQYHLLVQLVNKQFDKAVINLHLTKPYFGDTKGNKIADIIKMCHRYNKKRGIKLNITTDFINDQQLLTRLAANDINVFMYNVKVNMNHGLSSALDYALSVDRPIAISNNSMFQHIRSQDILLEHNSLLAILKKGLAPLAEHRTKWSTNNFITELDEFLSNEYINIES